MLEIFKLEEDLTVSLVAERRTQSALGPADMWRDPLQRVFDVFLHGGTVPDSRNDWK